MKEKVKELALQCGAWHQVYGDCLLLHNHNFDIEKFSDMIVKECAEVAGCNGHVSGFALGDLIKEHFGVEE
jgi:hypothetical protein